MNNQSTHVVVYGSWINCFSYNRRYQAGVSAFYISPVINSRFRPVVFFVVVSLPSLSGNRYVGIREHKRSAFGNVVVIFEYFHS